MTRRTSKLCVLAALAALTAMIAGENPVLAAGVTVTGTGGQVTGTDPQFYYDFRVTLSADYTLNPGDYFIIQGLLGVTPYVSPANPGSPTIEPPPFGSPKITVTSTDPMTGIDTSSVQWTNPLMIGGGSGITLSGGANGLLLGDFLVYTTQAIPTIPESVILVALSHDPSGNPYHQNDIVIPLQFVPEPSSVVLLLGGMGFLSGVIHRRRTRLRRAVP